MAMIFACKNCGAELSVDEALRTTVCIYCDTPSVVESPSRTSGPRPAFTVGFVQPEAQVRKHVARWLRTRNIFCPGSIRHANVENLKGVYVPAYLYSAVSRTDYAARIGENYTETETYTTTDKDGKTVTKTRTVVKTEWRSLRGTRAANVSDVLVTASKGLSNSELEAIEPFDWRALRRYSPAMVAGWPAENASLDVVTCLQMARDEAEAHCNRALSGFMPGDSHQIVSARTSFEKEAVDLVLVPTWLLNARYAADKPPIRIVVNGQTGAVHGKPPLSALRIALAIVLLALLAGGIYFLVDSGAFQ